MNALVTRNRELISRSGSYVRAADGVARGGDPPRHSVFFFAKSVTFPGVFFIDVIYFQKVPHYDPLAPAWELNKWPNPLKHRRRRCRCRRRRWTDLMDRLRT